MAQRKPTKWPYIATILYIHAHTQTQTHTQKSITSADKNWRRVPNVQQNELGVFDASQFRLLLLLWLHFYPFFSLSLSFLVWMGRGNAGVDDRGAEVAATPIIWNKSGAKRCQENGYKRRREREICQSRRIPIRL